MPNDNVTIQPMFADASGIYNLDFSAVVAGAMPAGWRCNQGNEVHEYPNTYTSGARAFSGFSGYQGKALYWRDGNAEYGRQTAYPLTLEAGSYKLTYAMAAWKGTPRYKVSILQASTGTAVAESGVLNAAPNANGNNAANLSSATKRTLEFNVETAGKYVISFTDESTASGLHEFLLVDCKLNIIPDGIEGIDYSLNTKLSTLNSYSLTGVRRNGLARGINIVRTTDGKARKILVK